MTNIEEAMKKLEQQRRSGEATAPVKPYVIAPVDKPRIDERIVSFHRPNSSLTETFKQFHSLIRNLSRESSATLAFVSAYRGEGRTTMAVNFAVALAYDVQGEICLVDADLRRPGVARALDLKPRHGLADVLAADVPLGSAILPTAVPRLSVLCAGEADTSPSELLRSAKMGRIAVELRERFDYTIFDTAPVLPVADAIHLASHVDGVVVVIEASKTKRRHVARALELLAHASVMGFVLNKAPAATDMGT